MLKKILEWRRNDHLRKLTKGGFAPISQEAIGDLKVLKLKGKF